MNRPAREFQRKQGFVRFRRIWAQSRFLPCKKFRVDHQAVLQIIDAQSRRFAKADRAEMPGHFDAVCVRCLHGRAQFFGRDVHVRLEGSHALRDPKLHHAACIFGILELVHLQRKRPWPFEVRSRDMNLGPGHLSIIDIALQLQVRVRLDAAGRSNRRHATREIQPRETRGMLGIQRRRAARRRVIHVVMHADKARDDRAAVEVQHCRAIGDLCACRVAERDDLSIGNHQSLTCARRCAGAVNDAHMR